MRIIQNAGLVGFSNLAITSPNWNEIKETGIYTTVSPEQPELPVVGALMVLSISSGIFITQICMRSNSASPQMWRRSKDSGGWGAWVQVLLAGDFGLGSSSVKRPESTVNGFISDTVNTPNWAPANGAGWQSGYSAARTAQVYITTAKEMYFRWNQEGDAMASNAVVPWLKIYHTGNVTRASDGSLKAASPVARIASPEDGTRSDINEDSFEWCGYGREWAALIGVCV